MVKILSQEQIQEAIRRYKNNESSFGIGKVFNVSNVAILGLLKRRGIDIRDYSHSRQIYKINENYFEDINNEDKAYWLGFFYADGYLSPKNEFSLLLSIKDKEHLEKLKRYLDSEHPIKEINYSYDTHKCYLRFKNKKIAKDLRKIINKGHLPNISSDLLPHFIRGLFDGDGSVGNYINPSFCLLAEVDILQEIRKLIGLSNTKLRKRHPERDGNIWAMEYCGKNNLKKIYNYLYQDATIFLERKKDIFEQVERRIRK